jgi:2-alkyl-3-oxoalkanoate reductase
LRNAVTATIAALDRGPAGSVYDSVDDQPLNMSDIVRAMAQYTGAGAPWTVPRWLPRLFAPFMARVTSMRLPLSNAKARGELGWCPSFPTYWDGLAWNAPQAACNEHP